MHWIKALIGIMSVAVSAFPGSRLAADPELPAGSRLLPGHLLRANNGDITVQQANRPQIRVCGKPSGGDCQFTDLAAAAAAAEPGAEIVLAAGLYEQGAVLAKDGLTLRGESGAHLKGHPVEGKAALVIRGAGVTIDGIECSDIQVPDGNGACIRIEADDLTVRNVNFHDNQDGILSGPGGGRVLVENSRFERNGYGGQAHGLYIGQNVREFLFRGNTVLSTKDEGHGVKSRAQKTVIEHNVIASLDGNDSRAIDLPNGGEVIIRDNLLEKGPNSANNQMIGLALEGPLHPSNKAILERNLIIFDPPQSQLAELLNSVVDVLPRRGTVVLSQSPGEVVLRNNVIVGAKEIGVPEPENADRSFRTRKAANLPAYPDVAPSLIEQALK
jgi:parallel beta helix pectate lyase-like protein